MKECERIRAGEYLGEKYEIFGLEIRKNYFRLASDEEPLVNKSGFIFGN